MVKKFLRVIGFIILFMSIFLSSVSSVNVLAQSNIVEVTAQSGLNLRKGPGTQYPVIKVLRYGSRWYSYGTSGNWLKLGNDQWVYASYVKAASPLKTVIVTAKSGLNVRTGPGTGYSITKVLTSGTKVDVLEEAAGWYRISNFEWIYSYYTKVEGGLDNTTLGWYYIANDSHTVPSVNTKVDISKYGGYYVGDTSRKIIYLTFDLGYEAGFTGSILDTLKENNVKAAFFVTKSYIDNNPGLVKRMVNEGHIVGNHTKTHPSLPSVATDTATFNDELISVETAYKNIIGEDMKKIMRPPSGEYSELSLYMTQKLGYKSIFWSFAYYDYDLNNQPDKTYAFNKITGGTHNGAIMLLHGVSKTNTEILDQVLDNIRNQGYEFVTLDSLP